MSQESVKHTVDSELEITRSNFITALKTTAGHGIYSTVEEIFTDEYSPTLDTLSEEVVPNVSSALDNLSPHPTTSTVLNNLSSSDTQLQSSVKASSTLYVKYSTNDESFSELIPLKETSNSNSFISVDSSTSLATTSTITLISEDIFSNKTQNPGSSFEPAATSSTPPIELQTFVGSFTSQGTSISNHGGTPTNKNTILEQNSLDSKGLAAAFGTLGVLLTMLIIAAVALIWCRSRKQKLRNTLMKLRSMSHQSRTSTVDNPPDLCLDVSAFNIAQVFPGGLETPDCSSQTTKRILSAHEDALNFSSSKKWSSVPDMEGQYRGTCSHAHVKENAKSQTDLKFYALSKSDDNLPSTTYNNSRGSFSLA